MNRVLSVPSSVSRTSDSWPPATLPVTACTAAPRVTGPSAPLATPCHPPARFPLLARPDPPQAALHPIVQKAFTDAFGPYAGWAHNALFVGELPAFPGRVRPAARRAAGGGKGAGAGAAGGGRTSAR